MITAEDVPGVNNYQGEVFYAQKEVCDLCAYYSKALLETPKRSLAMTIISMIHVHIAKTFRGPMTPPQWFSKGFNPFEILIEATSLPKTASKRL